MTTPTQASERVWVAGLEHGRAAGSWVFDGNTHEDMIRRVLQGYDDGDPETMELLEPYPLSGEWADDPTPATVYAIAGVDDPEAFDPAGQLLTDYELAFSEGFWGEVIRSGRAMLGEGDAR